METTVLNKAQLEMLEMMSCVKDDELLGELKEILSAFIAKKMDERVDALWESGVLTEEKVNGFISKYRSRIGGVRCNADIAS